MPLSLDALRNFGGNDRLLVDARSGAVLSENRLQRFKSFFNIGDARQKNAETLSMIHHAFLNDPRFSSGELQREVARLLNQVRTDRALGAAQIRNIVDTMFKLADSREGFGSRVEAHVAATGLPDSLRGVERPVLDYVKASAFAGRNSPGFDLAGRIREVVEPLDAAFSHAGPDPDLRDVLSHGAAIDTIVRDNDGTPAYLQTLRGRVDALRASVAAVAGLAAGAPDPAAAKRAGLELLGRYGKPVDPAHIAVLARLGARYDLSAFAALGPGSTRDDIARAVLAVGRQMSSVEVEWPDGVRPPDPADRELQSYLRRFALQNAVMALPADVRGRLLDALESPEGHAAAQFVYIEGGRNPDRQTDVNAIAWTAEILQCEAGRPEGYPGGFPRGRKLVADPAGFGPLARCAYSPDHAVSGTAAGSILRMLPGLAVRPGDPDPGATFHRKVDAGVSALATSAFAAGMKRLAAGAEPPALDGPEVRSAEIFLPDGSRLPADPAAARDALARLATGRADATYAALDPADRAKTNVLIALLPPALDETLEVGVPMSLGRDGGTAEVFGATRPGQPSARTIRRTFSITGSATTGFAVNYRMDRPADEIMLGALRRRTSVVRLVPGQGAFEYEMAFNVPPDTFARAAALDWGAYDGTAAADALNSDDGNPHPNRLAEVREAVPAAYRFDLGVAAGFHFHGDEA